MFDHCAIGMNQMPSIQKRDNGRWRARYRDAAGKEHARHFRRKVDAEAWLNSITVQVGTGTYIDPARGVTTVTSVAKAWVKNPDWEASTRARNESILNRHVLPRWGDRKLADVDVEQIQEWVNELSESKLAGGTVRKIHGVLSSVLDRAVDNKRLASNPCRSVKLPKQQIKRRRYLTAAQVEALADAADEYGDIVLVLAYCGLRIGELAALKVRSVDVRRRRFTIEESVTEVNGKLVWTSPKDHQRRTVPYPKFLDDDIDERMKDRTDDDLLFPSTHGGTLRVRNMRRDWFDVAAKVAGVEGLTPHELRHTTASLAVSAGASVLALQRMLGHDKPSTTLDTYSDLFDEDLDAVAESLERVRTNSLADYLRTAGDSGGQSAKSAAA